MQALHIFKYLDVHKENMLNFDPTYLDLPEPLNPNENAKCKIEAMKWSNYHNEEDTYRVVIDRGISNLH